MPETVTADDFRRVGDFAVQAPGGCDESRATLLAGSRLHAGDNAGEGIIRPLTSADR
jgi:hypothetical protein